MTITLDDLFVLLDIPVEGQFFPYGVLDFDSALSLLVELFGVDMGDSTIEIRHCCVSHVKLNWLP